MNLEQILEAVAAAGWDDAHICDPGVNSNTTGQPVRWVWAFKDGMIATANEGVKAPQYNPPIIHDGMTFRVHRPTMRGENVEFTNITKAPTPEQVAQMFAMIDETTDDDLADQAEAATQQWAHEQEVAAAAYMAFAEIYTSLERLE